MAQPKKAGNISKLRSSVSFNIPHFSVNSSVNGVNIAEFNFFLTLFWFYLEYGEFDKAEEIYIVENGAPLLYLNLRGAVGHPFVAHFPGL